jgi:hypothetical protein
MQSSLPAGWLAFTGRASNPLDRYKRFQIKVSSSFSGLSLAQGKFRHDGSPSICIEALSAPFRDVTVSAG